jgi:hypothetical protein
VRPALQLQAFARTTRWRRWPVRKARWGPVTARFATS